MKIDLSDPWRRRLVLACAFLATAIGGVIIGAWLCTKPDAPAGEWNAPKQDGRLADIPTETIKPPDCAVVVAKPGAKKKLDLPPEVQADPKKHVTTAVIIQPDERPQSVSAIFNEATGTTDILTQRLAYPWLAIEQRGQLWAGYGLKLNGERAWRILMREDLLQLKALHLGAHASIDTGGQWFAGVGVGYRW